MSLPVYTTIGKPTTTSIDFLFQDGEEYLFQDDVNKAFASNIADLYNTISRPSAPTYTTIPKPS